VLDPLTSSFSFDTFVKIPAQINDNQVITQRNSTSAAVTLAISSSNSTTACNVLMLVSSASDAYVVASGSILKDSWVHITAQIEEENGAKRAAIYLNGSCSYVSSDKQDFGTLNFNGQPLLIGSGTTHTILDYSFAPKTTYSGSIDEFRYFNTQRTLQQINSYDTREIYSNSGSLVAYFKFNEPSGSYRGNNVVLDSSGNKLHSYITFFSSSLRVTGSSPLVNEDVSLNPILFANHSDITTLNETLLDDASAYDNDNPNFIIKLIPQHYLTQGAQASGFKNIDQNIGNPYTATSIPGTGVLQKPQTIISFLLLYAKFFDEIKMLLDYFTHVNYVELDDAESAIDKFLPFVADYYGIDLPNFFSNTTPEQFFYGKNLSNDYSISTQSLKEVRYQIWRRILGNFTELVQSKGTRSSIKGAILATGIIPENFFNIREYGGPTTRNLSTLRQQTQETSQMLDMSGSSAVIVPVINGRFFARFPHIISPFLSSSRTEPGYPIISGTFIQTGSNYISNCKSDGLLTSGSFTIENTVKFNTTTQHSNTQSIVRLNTTGSQMPCRTMSCILNLTYNHDSTVESGSINLKVRPSKSTVSPILDLNLTGVNLFNGEKWYVSCGRVRNDLTSSLSSSYFIHAGYNEDQTSFTYFTTSSFFNENVGASGENMFEALDDDYNASGSFITIGSQSYTVTGSLFLNVSESFTQTHFDGLMSQFRFWSKATNEDEAKEHIRNFRSLGVINPQDNFNFIKNTSGSFERLRIDANIDQATTSSDALGNITIFDFSQNNMHLSGSGFEFSKKILKNELFVINRISPNFDLLQTDDKVRVRSLLDTSNSSTYTAQAPLNTLGQDVEINDDTRFSIEYSVVKALNEDMIGMFGNTQTLDEALGQQSFLFDSEYNELQNLSYIYFNRLTDKIDIRRYLELFKWFDNSLTALLNQFIPRKVNFLGVNYVVESHMLERHKHRYLYDKQYLGTQRTKADLTSKHIDVLTGSLRRF